VFQEDDYIEKDDGHGYVWCGPLSDRIWATLCKHCPVRTLIVPYGVLNVRADLFRDDPQAPRPVIRNLFVKDVLIEPNSITTAHETLEDQLVVLHIKQPQQIAKIRSLLACGAWHCLGALSICGLVAASDVKLLKEKLPNLARLDIDSSRELGMEMFNKWSPSLRSLAVRSRIHSPVDALHYSPLSEVHFGNCMHVSNHFAVVLKNATIVTLNYLRAHLLPGVTSLLWTSKSIKYLDFSNCIRGGNIILGNILARSLSLTILRLNQDKLSNTKKNLIDENLVINFLNSSPATEHLKILELRGQTYLTNRIFNCNFTSMTPIGLRFLSFLDLRGTNCHLPDAESIDTWTKVQDIAKMRVFVASSCCRYVPSLLIIQIDYHYTVDTVPDTPQSTNQSIRIHEYTVRLNSWHNAVLVQSKDEGSGATGSGVSEDVGTTAGGRVQVQPKEECVATAGTGAEVDVGATGATVRVQGEAEGADAVGEQPAVDVGTVARDAVHIEPQGKCAVTVGAGPLADAWAVAGRAVQVHSEKDDAGAEAAGPAVDLQAAVGNVVHVLSVAEGDDIAVTNPEGDVGAGAAGRVQAEGAGAVGAQPTADVGMAVSGTVRNQSEAEGFSVDVGAVAAGALQVYLEEKDAGATGAGPSVVQKTTVGIAVHNQSEAAGACTAEASAVADVCAAASGAVHVQPETEDAGAVGTDPPENVRVATGDEVQLTSLEFTAWITEMSNDSN
jgi:hypothetical protein